MIFRYVLKELKAYPRYTILFVFNIVLGLTGLAALESFKSSVERELHATSRSQAGGDLVVSSRLQIPQAELDKVTQSIRDENARYTMAEAEELFSMATSGQGSRLVQIRAQDPILPFYGEIELAERGTYRGGDVSDLESGDHVWVYPELLVQFGLSVGNDLIVGGHKFKITAQVSKDSAAQMGRASLAPRVYMSRDSLRKTGLIQKGSTAFYQKIFRIEPASKVEAIEIRAKSLITDSSINVNSHINVNEANARMISYLNDYLGLVALIALLLSNIGAVYLFRAHLTDRLRDMAVLKMIGLRVRRLAALGFAQTVILGTIGSLVAVTVSLFVFPLIGVMTEDLLPFSVDISLEPRAVVTVLFVGVLGTAFCVWPLIQRARRLSPRELFQEGVAHDLKLEKKDLIAWLPFVFYFYALSVWQANSIKIASLFVGLIALAAILLFAIGAIGLVLLNRLNRKVSFELRFALRELARRPVESLTGFVALALGGLLVSLILTVETSLQTEFEFGPDQERPSLFLFDIQDEQLEELKAFTQEAGRPLQNISPLIRGRLEAINGEAYQREEIGGLKTREDEQSERSRTRAFNLTERGVLSKAEEVVEGRYFQKPFNPDDHELPEISVEQRFAERMKVKTGDILTFDVLGVPVEAVIVGLRRVKWASFQPNFFVQFQEGVFTDTPKSHIASVGPMSEDERLRLQTKMVERFPNISILDVTRTVERLMELAGRMAWVLKFMAALVLFTSIGVVVSIQTFHVHRNAGERRLMELLGVLKSRIRRIESLESWLLSASALFFGWAVSFVVVWPVTHIVFNRPPNFSWAPLGVALLFVGTAFIFMTLPVRTGVKTPAPTNEHTDDQSQPVLGPSLE